VPTVNIEGFDASRTLADIWAGGSQRADLSVDGATSKGRTILARQRLNSISSYDHTHALYEEDNTGDGISPAPARPRDARAC